ncbi:MAG: methylenetetrahydrofolate reductase, partial [Lachnospiraceae bacterium]|nr:methylenetetrahydrofolate reductase [Lachnospiraceae bacterium]
MKIADVFAKKKPILSFEIFPPKKAEALECIDETLGELCRLNPDFISVTFGAGGTAASNKTIELGRKIKDQFGIEPLIHLTCLNYNKEEILAILNRLRDEELFNILALRGDVNPEAAVKDDFRYAKDLVAFICEQGDEFSVSGACYPETHLEAESKVADIRHLKAKVDAGATHLVSQLFFENELFYDFYE